MARNVQLVQLVEQLRQETGKSTVAGVGTDDLDSLKHILKRTQERLYDDYDWPHLTVRPTVQLAAGQRYYDLPSDLNYEQIAESYCWHTGNKPYPIDRGISVELYGIYDPTANERSDPAQRWDIVWTGLAEQIEVWPLPASNDDKLQFVGKRKLRALTADSDVCDLDDQLIVLHCAAELLARAGDKDAQVKAGLATARLNQLRGRTKGGTHSPLIIGSGAYAPRERLRAKYNPNAGA